VTAADSEAVQPSIAPAFLTAAQLADRWVTTTRNIRRLMASGSLPAVRIGAQTVRIALEDIEAFEQQRKTA